MGLKTWLQLKGLVEKPLKSELFDIGLENGDRAFLHIGKTGGTSVGRLIMSLRKAGWQTPAKIDHRSTLAVFVKAHPNVRLSVILRDPLERIVSGFNSRLRQGRPLKNNVWSTDEAVAFSLFRNVESLLDAMLSDDDYQRSAVAFTMRSIRHLARGYEYYFRTPAHLDRNSDRLYFIGDIRDMRAALAGIFAPIPAEVLDAHYERTHVGGVSSGAILAQYTDEQIRRMKEFLAGEYAIYDRLVSLSARGP